MASMPMMARVRAMLAGVPKTPSANRAGSYTKIPRVRPATETFFSSCVLAFDPNTNRDMSNTTAVSAADSYGVTKQYLPSGLAYYTSNGVANKRISLTGVTAQKNLATYTLVMWVNLSAVHATLMNTFWSKAVWALMVTAVNRQLVLQNYYNAWATSSTWYSTSNAFVFGEWQCIGVSYDWSNVNNDPVYYVNGISVPVSSISRANSGTRIDEGASLSTIFDTTSNNKTLNGSIGQTWFFNTILTADNALQIYEQTRGYYGV